jgi:hypothetical protein
MAYKDHEDSYNRKDGKKRSAKKGRYKPQAARKQKAKLKGTLSRLENASEKRKNELKKIMGY